MREFKTGATRDTDEGKYDYEGFLSPSVIERYAAYMHQHRKQANGKLRASDNWQAGLPPKESLKSLWRHMMDVWKIMRGLPARESKEEALCAIIFNASSMLHEELRAKGEADILVGDSPSCNPEAQARFNRTLRDVVDEMAGRPPEEVMDEIYASEGFRPRNIQCTCGIDEDPRSCICDL